MTAPPGVARKLHLSQLILQEVLSDEGDPDDDPIEQNDILMVFLIEATAGDPDDSTPDELDEPSEPVQEVQEGVSFARRGSATAASHRAVAEGPSETRRKSWRHQ